MQKANVRWRALVAIASTVIAVVALPALGWDDGAASDGSAVSGEKVADRPMRQMVDKSHFDAAAVMAEMVYVAQAARPEVTLVMSAVNSASDGPIEVGVTAKEDASEKGRAGAWVLRRTGPTDARLIVSYTVSGSATAGTDYEALSGTATFPIGEESVKVQLVAIDDADDEGTEDVVLTLTSGDGYVLSADKTAASLDISDDDAVPAAPDTGVMPAEKSDCKNGGWESYDVFDSKGDCVAWVLSDGANPPGDDGEHRHHHGDHDGDRRDRRGDSDGGRSSKGDC